MNTNSIQKNSFLCHDWANLIFKSSTVLTFYFNWSKSQNEMKTHLFYFQNHLICLNPPLQACVHLPPFLSTVLTLQNPINNRSTEPSPTPHFLFFNNILHSDCSSQYRRKKSVSTYLLHHNFFKAIN